MRPISSCLAIGRLVSTTLSHSKPLLFATGFTAARGMAGSPSQSPAEVFGRNPSSAAPVTPATGSFLATGKPSVVDTLYFRKIAAPSGSKSVANAYTPDSFAGQVLLLVNTASMCGFTPQLRQLQSLYKKYSDVGLTVVALPCNDFGEQEPWEESRVQAFYKEEYGVTFPISGKVGIKTNRHALYEFIADSFGEDALPIWNFHKVLIGRDGQIKGLFPASMAPNDPQIVTAIHRELESTEPRAEIA